MEHNMTDLDISENVTIYNTPLLFECGICEKKFKRKAHLNRHVKSHNSKLAINETCNICGMSFTRKDNLKRHYENIRKHHTPKSTHLCSDCGKACSGKQDLLNHSRIHETPLVCDVCYKLFNRKDNLHRHVKIHQRMSQQCPECKGYFNNVKRHRKEKCNKPSVFTCSCGKIFATKRYLHEHRKRIHEQKMFECKLCEMKFNSRTTRRKHFKEEHTSIKLQNTNTIKKL